MQPEWEIWLDTNISPIIAKWLMEYTGYVVKSSYTLSINFSDDISIYLKAKKQGNVILVSKDADFPELISRLGSPPKLISLKFGNCDNKALWEYIQPNIRQVLDILITSETDIVELE